MTFELSHFEAYFHIFAATNVAYAISSGFRGIIQSGLKNISHIDPTVIDDKIKLYKRALVGPLSAMQNEKVTAKVEKELTKLKSKYQERIINYDSLKDANRKVWEYKSLYLFSGLFCFAMLILCGFQQFFDDEMKFYIMLYTIDLAALIFTGIVVFLSFVVKREKQIGIVATFLIALVCFGLCLGFAVTCPISKSVMADKINMRQVMIYAITVPIVPFIVQLLKEISVSLDTSSETSKIEASIQKDLDRLKDHIDFLRDED